MSTTSTSAARNSFIVTTSIGGTSRTQLWDAELPLTLGHPLRWIAERTQNGVRIRHLGARPGQIARASVCEIPDERLGEGAELRLPDVSGVSLRIRRAREQAPMFGRRTGDRLSVYACAGDWVLRSTLFESQYLARAARTPVFALREKSGEYVLDVRAEGVRLKIAGEAARELKKGEAAQVPADRIAETAVHFGRHSWRFGLSAAAAEDRSDRKAPLDGEATWFRRALGYAAAGLGAVMIVAWLWPAPKPDTDVLIPAQFAKIILAKPPAAPAQVKAQASEGNPTQAPAVPEKVAKAAVVQAFRAKALSSAVSGLLKGGMTSLLAQSDFVAGRTASADARKSFDQRSAALAAGGPATGLAADTNHTVATLGGSGTGKGAGYGKGEHAGVKGQGQAFVSMDIAGAAVDEGLTKDEVGKVIHRHLSEVRYCYESAMIRSPDLEGKLMVNFTIGGTGAVKTTEIKSSTLPDPRLDDCILRRLATWKFPNPRGGIDVAVTYPFIFKSLGR